MVIVISLVILSSSQPSLVALNSPVALSVYSEDFSTSNITNPSLILGDSFNMSILAANIPIVSGQNSGGISGFDIALAYNSSVLKIVHAWSTGPECLLSDNCIFDMPANDTLTTSHTIDSPSGTSRIGVLALGPSHKPDLSNLQGLPAVLFRVQFAILGTGATSINIQQASSQITGFLSGCGNLLPFTVTNGRFDNRSPFAIRAFPLAGSVTQGKGLTVSVNVTRVNNLGNGTVTLLLSNAINGTGYLFKPREGILNATHESFISNLTITTAPTTLPGKHVLTIIGVLQNYPQYNLDFSLNVISGSSPYAANLPISASNQVIAGPLPKSTPLSSSLIATFNLDSVPVVNNPVRFSGVAVWCSSSPYSLHWDFGDGSSGTGNPVSHAYSRTGTFTVILTLTDNGNTYASSRDVTVTSQSTPSPSSSLDLYSTLALGLTGFVMVALVLALVLKPRRRKSSS